VWIIFATGIILVLLQLASGILLFSVFWVIVVCLWNFGMKSADIIWNVGLLVVINMFIWCWLQLLHTTQIIDQYRMHWIYIYMIWIYSKWSHAPSSSPRDYMTPDTKVKYTFVDVLILMCFQFWKQNIVPSLFSHAFCMWDLRTTYCCSITS